MHEVPVLWGKIMLHSVSLASIMEMQFKIRLLVLNEEEFSQNKLTLQLCYFLKQA